MSPFISLLNAHYGAFIDAYDHRLTTEMRRAIHAMRHCKTATGGSAQWHCDRCQHDDRLPLSCGHRHCPQCQHRATLDWFARQDSKRLPVHYFMITFTLPAELRPLAQRHARELYALMFSVAAGVLKDFAQRKHGGKTGFTMVLHTHNRQRELHPHLHVVMPAGHYDPKRQQWHRGQKHYLYNAFALADVWRARILDGIAKAPGLSLPSAFPKQWRVDCRHVGRGPSVLKYLSRYLYRGILPDRDILTASDNEVIFRYRHSGSQQWRTRTLPTLKFLWLILQHVLPKGLKRVRDYGLLHGSARQIRLQIQRLLLQMGWRAPPMAVPSRVKAQRSCPCCQHQMICLGVVRTR